MNDELLSLIEELKQFSEMLESDSGVVKKTTNHLSIDKIIKNYKTDIDEIILKYDKVEEL